MLSPILRRAAQPKILSWAEPWSVFFFCLLGYFCNNDVSTHCQMSAITEVYFKQGIISKV